MVDSKALDSNAPVTVDADGQALMERHADWWKRKRHALSPPSGANHWEIFGFPCLTALWPLQDMDITPDMLDMDRLAGEPLAPGTLDYKGDQFRHAAPFSRVPWVEAISGHADTGDDSGRQYAHAGFCGPNGPIGKTAQSSEMRIG